MPRRGGLYVPGPGVNLSGSFLGRGSRKKEDSGESIEERIKLQQEKLSMATKAALGGDREAAAMLAAEAGYPVGEWGRLPERGGESRGGFLGSIRGPGGAADSPQVYASEAGPTPPNIDKTVDALINSFLVEKKAPVSFGGIKGAEGRRATALYQPGMGELTQYEEAETPEKYSPEQLITRQYEKGDIKTFQEYVNRLRKVRATSREPVKGARELAEEKRAITQAEETAKMGAEMMRKQMGLEKKDKEKEYTPQQRIDDIASFYNSRRQAIALRAKEGGEDVGPLLTQLDKQHATERWRIDKERKTAFEQGLQLDEFGYYQGEIAKDNEGNTYVYVGDDNWRLVDEDDLRSLFKRSPTGFTPEQPAPVE